MSRPRRPTRPDYDHPDAWPSVDLYDAYAELAVLIGKYSIELIGSVAADPAVGVPLAEAEGVVDDLFQDEDLAGLWLAIKAGAESGRDQVGCVKLCRELLRRQGYWNPQGPVGSGMQWSDESLVRLFFSFPGTFTVPANARRLVESVARWRAAQRLVTGLRRLLLGQVEVPERPAAAGPGRELAA